MGSGNRRWWRRGTIDFQPGEEMQHDTSPHEVELGGKRRKVQTASAVLCYSRMLFFQLYPTFQRFDCKVFLTEALRYFNGAPATGHDRQHPRRGVARHRPRRWFRCPRWPLLPNVSASASQAHERGDANRSARVERPFRFIENNFLAGRTFASWQDLNQQARQWCDRVNATYKKHIRAVPRELFVLEQQASAPAAGLDSRGLSPARTHGGRGRLRRAAQQSLLGSGRLDRPPRRSARDQGQDRDPTRCPPPGHPPAHRRGRAPARAAGRNTARRGARASSAPIPIPKKSSFSRPRPRSPTMSRL